MSYPVNKDGYTVATSQRWVHADSDSHDIVVHDNGTFNVASTTLYRLLEMSSEADGPKTVVLHTPNGERLKQTISEDWWNEHRACAQSLLEGWWEELEQ